MMFMTMYMLNMISIVSDQCSLNAATMQTVSTAAARKIILRIPVLRSWTVSFPNFMENIGISLTRSRERTIDNAGTNQQLWHNEARTLSGDENAKQASEPHIIAQAGVGRPRNPLCWRSSRLNLASLSAENTAMMSGM